MAVNRTAGRRAHFGCLEKVRKGVYRFRYMADTPEGRKRVNEMIYGTAREAEKVRSLRWAQSKDPCRYTCGDVWEVYIVPSLEESIRPQTLQGYLKLYRLYVGPRWGSVPINQVRAMDVQSWLQSMSRANGSGCLKVLRKITRWGVMMDALDKDPCAVKFQMGKANSQKVKVWNLAELRDVWKAVYGSYIEPVFLLSAHGGLRVGEAVGVKRGDMTFENGDGGCICIVDVQRQINVREEVGPLKTERSYRRAAITSPWSDRLFELVEGLEADEWVVNDGSYEQPKRHRVNNMWTKLIKATDLDYAPLRMLRSSYETYMHWELGTPIDIVSRLLGHTQISTTMKHYDRPQDKSLIYAAAQSSMKLSDDCSKAVQDGTS